MKRTKHTIYGTIYAIVGIFVIISLIQILRGDTPQVDKWMQQFTSQYTDTSIYTFFRAMTELGSFHVVAPVTIIGGIVLWIIMRDYRPALVLGLGVLTTHFLNQLIKHLVARERPSISAALNAEGFSFPSGHAMIPIVCYGLLAYFITKQIKQASTRTIIISLITIMVFLIGLSRPFLNVHYLTDTITGFFIGSISLYVWIKIYQMMKNKSSPID